MATTFDPYGERSWAAGQAARGPANIKSVAGEEIKNLIADVEDLLARLRRSQRRRHRERA